MPGNKTALYSSQNPGGVFAIEDQGYSTGSRFFVDSVTGSTTFDGQSPNTPKATIAQAVALCTADKDDIVYVMPKHVETTTALDINKAGIRIIGLGYGRNKPALTATAAATDLLGVSAANVYMENIRFVGAASACTALLNIGAADFYGKGLVFEHGAAPLDAVTVPASSHRFVLEDCQWRGTAAGPDRCIVIEGKVDDFKVIRARADYGGSSGLDDGFLVSSFKMKGYEIVEPIIVGFDTLVIDINSSSAAVGDGVLIGGGSVASTGITIANAHDVGGCAIINHLITDVVTARGFQVPAATPS